MEARDPNTNIAGLTHLGFKGENRIEMPDKNEIKDIVDALIKVKIAVESLAPDPT